MSDWIILRTSGRHTLPLAASLARHGFECWTPAWQRRIPRRRDELPAPLLPTFVFAWVSHLSDLLETATDPLSPHPAFSVFHFDRRIPVVADEELRGLRLAERRRISPEKQRAYRHGETVMPTDGAWAGMSGIVEKDQGKFVLVTFDRWEVRIARFLLDPGERMAA